MRDKGNLIGWKGICSNSGKFVAVEDGLAYVLEQLGLEAVNPKAPEADALPELVEWYFSGNWIGVYEDG